VTALAFPEGNVRVWVQTLRAVSFRDVPESIHWDTGECKGKKCFEANGDAYPQDNINGDSRLRDAENASILHTYRNFDKSQRHNASQ
jgi:hypothetical protein